MLTKKLIDERYQIILIQSNSEANAKLPSGYSIIIYMHMHHFLKI